MTGDERDGQAVVRSPDPALDAPAERTIERFLRRVAALDAAEWGRLDAAGQRLNAGDPLARWERSRRLSAVMGALPLYEAVLTPVGFTVAAVRDLARWLRDAPPEPWGTRPPQDLRAPGHPVASRFARRTQELWDTAAARPAGPGPAIAPLMLAFLALNVRSQVPAEAFARMYEPVEPVIPVASL